MEQTLDPGCYAVLQLMLARGLFIGDEVRISSLRTAWGESGQTPEALDDALSHLQNHTLIKLGHSKTGPVAQLSQQGFALGQQKRQAPPQVERRSPPAPNSTPPQRRRRVEYLKPEHAAKVIAPSQSRRAGDQAVRNRVTHGSVFGEQSNGPSTNVLQMCVLGLLRNRGLRANEQLDYSSALQDWILMQLPQDDLLLALKRLNDSQDIEIISRPQERILLTRRGYERYERSPTNLEEGMDRWQARKYLRATKRLGAMPAA